MEKLFQLEERKKSATNVEARRAAMEEKEKKLITLTVQPGLLPLITNKVDLSKAAEKRRKLIEMEKLAKLEERKKSAKIVKAAMAGKEGNEQLGSTLYFGPGLLMDIERRNNTLPQLQERKRRLEYLPSNKNTFSR